MSCCNTYIYALVAVVPSMILYFVRKYFQGGVCRCTARMAGKTVLITGGNDGIGRETARLLAAKGGRVIMACRDMKKAEATKEEIKQLTGSSNVVAMKLDLASLSSVRSFAEELLERELRLDVLINNAGIFHVPRSTTEDGHEIVFQTNYLGHFLLTMLLLDRLKESAPSRIVNVSSIAYRDAKGINFDDPMGELNYGKFPAYAQSKLAQVLFTRTLADKLKGTGVTVNVLHPGVVYTNIFKSFPKLSDPKFFQWPIIRLTFKSTEQGAQTSVHCASSPECEHITGSYFKDCALFPLEPHAKDDAAADKLWSLSHKLLGLQERQL